MKIFLLIPFLLGNSAGGNSMILEGLLSLVVVFGVLGALVWGAIKLYSIITTIGK
jgi:hypothetical protein